MKQEIRSYKCRYTKIGQRKDKKSFLCPIIRYYLLCCLLATFKGFN